MKMRNPMPSFLPSGLKNLKPKGSILIGIILVILLFGALGAAIVSITGTSSLTPSKATNAERAYLLAESGFRYVESKLEEKATEALKNQALSDLSDTTYAIGENGREGQIHLTAHPFFFITKESIPARSRRINAGVNGKLPPQLLEPNPLVLPSGYLQIKKKVYSYRSAIVQNPDIRFILSPGQNLPALLKDEEILIVARSDGSDPTDVGVTNSIQLASGSGKLLPEKNAEIELIDIHGKKRVLSYSKREADILYGIKDRYAEDGAPLNLSISKGAHITLKKFVRIVSVGEFGEGSLKTRRSLTYHFPLIDRTEKTEVITFKDEFKDRSDWISDRGSHEAGATTQNRLLVTGHERERRTGAQVSLATLNLRSDDNTHPDLPAIHQDHGGFLSYDLQVKMGNALTLPDAFASGISFRLTGTRGNLNGYGFSFLKPPATIYESGGLDKGMTPFNGSSFFVLWQKVQNRSERTWLAFAYTEEKEIYRFYTRDELLTFSANGLWHITDHRTYEKDHTFYYGLENQWHYGTNAPNSGTLESTEMRLPMRSECSYGQITLSFWSYFDTRRSFFSRRDIKTIEISNDFPHFDNWDTLLTLPDFMQKKWHNIRLDLSQFEGDVVKIRFRFDTVNRYNGRREGWYIENIALTGDLDFKDITLLTRVEEAASVSFENGLFALEEGDIIKTDSGGVATLLRDPVLSEGVYGDRDDPAMGLLLLNQVTGTFENGETIRVAGKGDFGTIGSQNGGISSGFRAKDIYMRCFYATHRGCGTPNQNPFDHNRHPYPRGGSDLKWPEKKPSLLTPDSDYFTLIKWKNINSDVTWESIERISSVNETDAVLRSRTHTTPDTPFLTDTRPEIGLHTFGYTAGRIYFDDFAIRLESAPTNRSPTPPIQE